MLKAACIYILFQTRNILETLLEKTTSECFLKLGLFWINCSPFDNHPLVAQGYHQKPLSPSHLWSSNFIVCQPPTKEKGTQITFSLTSSGDRAPVPLVPALCQHDRWQTARSVQWLWTRRRSASRSVWFLGTKGVTAEEEFPRWHLIRQFLCCDADDLEGDAHPFSHLPAATGEWNEAKGHSRHKYIQGPAAAGMTWLYSQQWSLVFEGSNSSCELLALSLDTSHQLVSRKKCSGVTGK